MDEGEFVSFGSEPIRTHRHGAPGLRVELPERIERGFAVYVDGKLYSSMTRHGDPLPPQALRVGPPGEQALSPVPCGCFKVLWMRFPCKKHMGMDSVDFILRTHAEAHKEDPAISMAHACACAVCPECSMGLDLIAPDDPDTSTAHVGAFIGYRHKLSNGKVVPCFASAIHRLIGTKT